MADQGGTSHIRLEPDDFNDPRGFVQRLNRKLDLLEGDIGPIATAAATAAAASVVGSRPGTAGVPGPPGPAGGSGTPAPNVTADGPTFSYRLYGHDTLPVFEGTITLPTTDPDYAAHFAQVIVFAIDPGTAEWIELARYPKPGGSETTIAYSGWSPRIVQKDTAQTGWKLRFDAINENAAPSASPYSIDDITIPAAAVASLTGADLTGERWLDLTVPGRSLHLVLSGTISCSNYPLVLTIWTNDGTGPKWHEWIEIDGAATVFKIGAKNTNTNLFAPAVTSNWTIIAAVGTYDGAPPGGAFTSAPFSVSAMAKPLATDVASLVIPSGAGGSFPYNRITQPDGYQDWSLATIGWDDTTAANDINAVFAVLTAQDLDATETPIGIEHRFGVVSVGVPTDDHARAWGELDGPYGNVAVPPRSGNIAYVRLRLYLLNRADASEFAWQNTAACATLQNLAGVGYIDKLVATGGASPVSIVASVPAPNITSATGPSIGFQLWAAVTVPTFSGTINLPTGNANYLTHFAQVIVFAVNPTTGEEVAIFRAKRPDDTGLITSIAYSGWDAKIQQTSAAQPGWKLRFVAYNEFYEPTASPVEISSITIPAFSITSLAGADSPSDRWVDPIPRSLHDVVAAAIACSNYPQIVTFWTNDGTTITWHETIPIAAPGVIKIGAKNTNTSLFVPAADQNWTVIAAIGVYYGSTPPGGATTSATFLVAAMAKPLATDVAALTVAAGVGGSFPYNRVTPDGYQDWDIPSITFDDTTASGDPNAAFAALTAQDLDASGNPIGVEHLYGSRSISATGGVQNWGDLGGPYGNVAVPARSGNVAQVGLRLYLLSRKNTSGSAWQDSTTSTLQTNVGTAGLLKVLVATGGATPAGQIQGPRVVGTVPNATNATNASNALTANNATNAANAATAGFANNAGAVPWGGLIGPLNVGGGGSAQTIIQYTNNANAVIAWTGKKTLSGIDYYGIWAANAWFGGTGPTDPKVWIDNGGNAHFSGVIESASSISSGISLNAPVINGGSLTITTASGVVQISSGSSGVSCNSGSGSIGQFGATQLQLQGPGGLVSTLNSATLMIGNTQVIDASRQFTGNGAYCPSYTITGSQVYAIFGYNVGTFTPVIDSSGQFVGHGVSCPSYSVSCASLTVGSGGAALGFGSITYGGEFGLTQLFAFDTTSGTKFLRFNRGGLVAESFF